jgi:hypothetical protein
MSEQSELAHQDVATYECHCGNQITFPERRWDALKYITGKLGYKNPSQFITANQSCCDRPEYMEMSHHE